MLPVPADDKHVTRPNRPRLLRHYVAARTPRDHNQFDKLMAVQFFRGVLRPPEHGNREAVLPQELPLFQHSLHGHIVLLYGVIVKALRTYDH